MKEDFEIKLGDSLKRKLPFFKEEIVRQVDDFYIKGLEVLLYSLNPNLENISKFNKEEIIEEINKRFNDPIIGTLYDKPDNGLSGFLFNKIRFPIISSDISRLEFDILVKRHRDFSIKNVNTFSSFFKKNKTHQNDNYFFSTNEYDNYDIDRLTSIGPIYIFENILDFYTNLMNKYFSEFTLNRYKMKSIFTIEFENDMVLELELDFTNLKNLYKRGTFKVPNNIKVNFYIKSEKAKKIKLGIFENPFFTLNAFSIDIFYNSLGNIIFSDNNIRYSSNKNIELTLNWSEKNKAYVDRNLGVMKYRDEVIKSYSDYYFYLLRLTTDSYLNYLKKSLIEVI